MLHSSGTVLSKWSCTHQTISQKNMEKVSQYSLLEGEPNPISRFLLSLGTSQFSLHLLTALNRALPGDHTWCFDVLSANGAVKVMQHMWIISSLTQQTADSSRLAMFSCHHLDSYKPEVATSQKQLQKMIETADKEKKKSPSLNNRQRSTGNIKETDHE